MEWFGGLDELPSIPGFVVMELVQDARNRLEQDSALRMVVPLKVVWPTPTDCQRTLENFVSFHLSHNLGLIDALIAACSVGCSAQLCTFNVKHYRMIPDLITAQPYMK